MYKKSSSDDKHTGAGLCRNIVQFDDGTDSGPGYV